MLLAGNPLRGFGVPPAVSGPDQPIRGLGTNPLFTQATQTQAAVGARPSGAQSAVAQQAHQAVTGGEAQLPAQQCMSPGCGGTNNGLCTNEGALIYEGGQWQVQSSSNAQCTSTWDVSAETLLKQLWKGYPAYVGPFPVDFVNNPNGQITILTSPSQIGSAWGDWVAQTQNSLLAATWPKEFAKRSFSSAPYQAVYTGYDSGYTPWQALLPMVVGDTGYISAVTGKPLDPSYIAQGAGGTAQSDFAWGQLGSWTANTWVLGGVTGAEVGEFPFSQGVPPQLASGGHALYPSKAWRGADVDGNPKTFVQYGADPNTYSYYSAADWMDAISPQFAKLGISLPQTPLYGSWGSINTYWNPSYPGLMPLAKFKNPITGANWGLWLSIVPVWENNQPSHPWPGDGSNFVGYLGIPGHENDPSRWSYLQQDSTHLGQWSPALDAPISAQLQVAVGPLPQPSLLDQILGDIFEILTWIPAQLEQLSFDLEGLLKKFVCGMNPQQLLATVPKNNPAAIAAAAAAIAAANLVQCNVPPPPVDCAAANEANNPVCAPPVVSTSTFPWGWILLAVGAAAVIIFASRKPRKTSLAVSGTKREPPPIYHPPKGPPPGVPLHPGMLKGSRRRRYA